MFNVSASVDGSVELSIAQLGLRHRQHVSISVNSSTVHIVATATQVQHSASTVQYSVASYRGTVQYSTAQYSSGYFAVQHCTVEYSTVWHGTVQYCTIPFRVQCSTALYSSSVQYSGAQCSTVQCSTTQYCTVWYSMLHNSYVVYNTCFRCYSTIVCVFVCLCFLANRMIQYSRVQVRCSVVLYTTTNLTAVFQASLGHPVLLMSFSTCSGREPLAVSGTEFGFLWA